ncbi:Nucleotide-binding universal stress protein, UspA family [Sanguibacter gelidistatuariae]|uniref:Nucleotide-binding universal stress protein, UspA family n=1 Tax=Sanguibacter gelidistatuariae TaxID=1814289 RepID=A0A1G6GTR7_9MICO|nr:universal stress protein [Sanguibacter gelidistatuariae]SDB85430.1 Nucleotide-binding universal stress protein, UspA family [Sanguibacter gelidistatuariae]
MAIVVGVDGSMVSAAALRWAAREAGVREDSLWIVHVRAPGRSRIPFGDGPLMEPDDAAHYGAQLLEEAARIARSEAPDIDIDVQGVTGQVATTLLEAAEEAALVVVGRSGHGTLGTIFLGSVSLRVAVHASCPVVVVPVTSDAHSAHVVAGIAVEAPGARQVLSFALDEAVRRSCRLTVVAAYSIPFAQALRRDPSVYGPYDPINHAVTAASVAALLAHVREERHASLEIDTLVVGEDPAGAITLTGRGAQLTVVGSRGHGTVAGPVLGSVSQAVLRHAGHPVVVVPAGESHLA